MVRTTCSVYGGGGLVLNCINCKEEVAPDKAKFFAQMFVCPDCYKIAERVYVRGRQELEMMLLLLKESIRVAIVQGELQFSGPVEDVSKEDFMTTLARLTQESRLHMQQNVRSDEEQLPAQWAGVDKELEQCQPTATIPDSSTLSLGSSKPSAAGKDATGPRSSDSTSGPDSESETRSTATPKTRA